MNHTYQSLEDAAWMDSTPERCPLLEAFSPVAIVGWASQIKFKLRDMIAKQEASRNHEYADLLRTYSNTWEKYPIDANMNRETLDLLLHTAEPYAKMDWNQQSFFAGLSRSLDQLIADQEALPGGVDTEQNMSMVGGGHGGSSLPPMTPGFGPEENAPPGLDGAPGAPAEGTPPAGGAAPAAGGPAPLPGTEEEEPGAPGKPRLKNNLPPPPA